MLLAPRRVDSLDHSHVREYCLVRKRARKLKESSMLSKYCRVRHLAHCGPTGRAVHWLNSAVSIPNTCVHPSKRLCTPRLTSISRVVARRVPRATRLAPGTRNCRHRIQQRKNFPIGCSLHVRAALDELKTREVRGYPYQEKTAEQKTAKRGLLEANSAHQPKVARS